MPWRSLTFATGVGAANARMRIKERRDMNHKASGEIDEAILDDAYRWRIPVVW